MEIDRMKQIVAWIALALTVVLAIGARAHGQDQGPDRVSNTYKTEHEEHVTVERTTTTVKETTVVHVQKPNYKCAIFVANHADGVDDKKALALQDLLTGYVSGKGFTVISREDVMSAAANINGKSSGSDVDAALSNESSALHLAQNLGADYVLVCTITSFDNDKQNYHDASQNIDMVSVIHKLRTTFRLLDVVDGGAEVAGVASATLVDRTDLSGGTDHQNVIDDLLDAAALNMADMLTQDARSGLVASAGGADQKHADVHFAVKATVDNLSFPVVSRRDDGRYEVMPTQYHPEVVDATVELDGVVVGSTGTDIAATPGLHKVRVHQTLFQDWDAMVNIHDGMKLPISLELNDEGVQHYADLTKLFDRLETHAILTDAQAKVLEGKATEGGHSSLRVDVGQGSKADMDVRDPGTGTIIHADTTRP
jgi:PEGA domain